MSKLEHRARRHLDAYGKRYPGAWRKFDEFRENRQALGNWPDTVFCPMAGAYAILSGGGANRLPPLLVEDVARLSACAAWRPSQGLYRFDPDLLAALWESPLSGDLPCELLRQMPAWCVYIDLSEQQPNTGLYGFFAHLEWDTNDGTEELRLLIDMEDQLLPIPLHLGPWSLETAIEKMLNKAMRQLPQLGAPVAGEIAALASTLTPALSASTLTPLLSLLLYLCSDEADYERPPRPQPKKTRHGWRLFPPDQPHTWDVGVRIGAALRKSKGVDHAGEGREPVGGGTRPRFHIRRAHWHTYFYGPREGERIARVRWLAPIAVNLSTIEDLPAVVRQVR